MVTSHHWVIDDRVNLGYRRRRVMHRFADRVVVITGATSGIGRAAAVAFAQEGAKVVIAGRHVERGEEVVTSIRGSGGEGRFVWTDMRDPESIHSCIRTAVDVYGRVDCAFNNAGIVGQAGRVTADQLLENWDEVIAVNLRGLFLSMKWELQQMSRQGTGVIVNNASDVGLVGSSYGVAPYVASKHGIVGLTRAAALEYAGRGIRINAICPGLTRTPMSAPISALPAEVSQQVVCAQTPLGRFADAEEIANTALWLCSDAASFITGAALSVDGGSTAR
jgi:NAD(P)-dependent dehydrogenase (short-subunit alcohol dehydrogenase family)